MKRKNKIKSTVNDLDTEEALADFKGKTEIRKQEKIEEAEDRDFRRGELLGKFTAKMLYR